MMRRMMDLGRGRGAQEEVVVGEPRHVEAASPTQENKRGFNRILDEKHH